MSAVTTASQIVPSEKSGKAIAPHKKTSKPKAKTAKVERINAGGGFMVDVISKPSKTAKTTGTAKVQSVAKKTTKTKTQRQYGMDEDRAAELRKAKAFNAYREGSSYWCVVEALHSLGQGKFHTADKLVAEYGKVCDRDSMKAFKAKECRNATTGLGWKERILQNAYVTTRQDYGKRMRDIGWEVRYEKTADGATYGLFRLTNGKGK